MTKDSSGYGGTVLNMPVNYIQKGEEGSTGMRFLGVERHGKKAVGDFIIERTKHYPQYQPRLWDCEDHCFLAAAEISCQFIGQPVAIALGKGLEGQGIEGFDHAVLILWFQTQENGAGRIDSYYFDATLGRFVDDFDTKLIVPMPFSGFAPDPDSSRNLPFKKPLKLIPKGALALDGKDYDFDLIDGPAPGGQKTVIETLTSKGVAECPIPEDRFKKALWDIYWKVPERVFWYFAHLRAIHMGAPVGFAIGTATTPERPNSYNKAVLALWKKPGEITYWDVASRKPLNKSVVAFKERLVIV